MEHQISRITRPLVASALLIIAAIYVAGYFWVSEVITTPAGPMRVLPSHSAYLIYFPAIAIEESATGRPCGYSE